MLHKEAWVAKLLGTHLSVQVQKRSNFHDEITRHWLLSPFKCIMAMVGFCMYTDALNVSEHGKVEKQAAGKA